jgi:ribulose-5-phosphate 4-epimerase/fuculose-1-phosphate aldolase
MHLGIHRIRKEVNVVLHFQSPCATAIACGQPEKVDFFVIPEVPIYIGPIGIVDYKIPGTQDLATAATAVMKNHNLALLKSHGLIAVGKTFDEVIQNAAFFELACEIILKGQDIQALSRDALDELKKTYGYTL